MSAALRNITRSLLASRVPAALGWIRAVRGHGRFRRQYGELQRRIAEALYPDGEIRVLAGPFAGMRHLDVVAHGCIAPHWIGSARHQPTRYGMRWVWGRGLLHQTRHVEDGLGRDRASRRCPVGADHP